MNNRSADSQQLQWFHFAPLFMGVEAAIWLAWPSASPEESATRSFLLASWPAIWMAVVAGVLGTIAATICQRRAGLGDEVALWLSLIWGKHQTAGQWSAGEAEGFGSNAGYTGLAEADLLVVFAAVLAAVGLAFSSSSASDLGYLPSAELVVLALISFVVLPGVPSVDWADWKLRPVTSGEPRTRRLIQMLRSRAGSPEEVLKAIRRATRIVPGVEEGEEAVSTPADQIAREYKVSMVRIPVALGDEAFSAQPEVVAVEKLNLEVSRSRLEALREKNRSQPLAYQKSLDDHVVGSRSGEIFELCAALEALFRKYRLSPWDRLQTTLAFCQEPNVRYASDDSPESVEDLSGTRAGEYCRYPLETLVDQEGDCDCHAVLAACLFYTLGYDCCVFRLRSKDRKSAHMATGVVPPGADVLLPETLCPRVGDRQYYYCETTGAWQIGRVPEDMDPDTIEICWPRKT